MSLTTQANRDFNKQILKALNLRIKVYLNHEFPRHYYKGIFVGFENNSQTICLENAVDEQKNHFDKIFIHGGSWVTFSVEGEPFPMEKLAERLKKILPGEVIKVSENNEIVLLGGKLIVTENGVKGRGPTRDRVQKAFEEFCAQELKK